MRIKALIWVGPSLRDLRRLKSQVRQVIGYQLFLVQLGQRPTDWKPMAIVGRGVEEIRIHSELEHRVLYVARFEEAVYVLHVFEKKTQKTPTAEIDVAKKRLASVMESRSRGGK